MNKLEEWFELAKRGTSGDMVWNILYDWKKDREELIQTIEDIVG